MHAHLQDGVTKANRNPKISGRPANAHHVTNLRVDVQNIRGLEILNACTNQDADAAETALQAHLQAAIQHNIGFM